MKIAEIKELSTKEIQEKIVAEKARLNQMEINHSITPLDNPKQITFLRKDIARLMTELRFRELNQQ